MPGSRQLRQNDQCFPADDAQHDAEEVKPSRHHRPDQGDLADELNRNSGEMSSHLARRPQIGHDEQVHHLENEVETSGDGKHRQTGFAEHQRCRKPRPCQETRQENKAAGEGCAQRGVEPVSNRCDPLLAAQESHQSHRHTERRQRSKERRIHFDLARRRTLPRRVTWSTEEDDEHAQHLQHVRRARQNEVPQHHSDRSTASSFSSSVWQKGPTRGRRNVNFPASERPCTVPAQGQRGRREAGAAVIAVSEAGPVREPVQRLPRPGIQMVLLGARTRHLGGDQRREPPNPAIGPKRRPEPRQLTDDFMIGDGVGRRQYQRAAGTEDAANPGQHRDRIVDVLDRLEKEHAIEQQVTCIKARERARTIFDVRGREELPGDGDRLRPHVDRKHAVRARRDGFREHADLTSEVEDASSLNEIESTPMTGRPSAGVRMLFNPRTELSDRRTRHILPEQKLQVRQRIRRQRLDHAATANLSIDTRSAPHTPMRCHESVPGWRRCHVCRYRLCGTGVAMASMSGACLCHVSMALRM